MCIIAVVVFTHSRDGDCVSTISLCQLTFNQKSFYSNYGVYYDGLASVCLRLEHELTNALLPGVGGETWGGSSRLVTCCTLVDPHYQPPKKLSEDESFEDSKSGDCLALYNSDLSEFVLKFRYATVTSDFVINFPDLYD